jgi:hypothetical protein
MHRVVRHFFVGCHGQKLLSSADFENPNLMSRAYISI